MLNYQAGAHTVPGLTYFTQADMWLKFAPADRLNVPAYNLEDYPKLMAHDFIADPPVTFTRRHKKNPLRLSTRLEWPIILPGTTEPTTVSIPVTTHPDEYYGHQLHRPSAFFHESDEGTETILPNLQIQHSLRFFQDVTSLFEKCVIYIAAFRSRAHQKQFGLQSFKVTMETTTPARVDHIIQRLGALLLAPPFRIHSDFIIYTDRPNTLAVQQQSVSPGSLLQELERRTSSLIGCVDTMIDEGFVGSSLKFTRRMGHLPTPPSLAS